MREPRIEKILELEKRVKELNDEFTEKAEELRKWFKNQHFTILEMELLQCDDAWDILGVIEDEEIEDEDNISEEEYFFLLEKFDKVLERIREKMGAESDD